MITLPISTNNKLHTLAAGLIMVATIFFGEVASAQTVKFVDNTPIHTQTTDAFKLAIFPVANSPLMKIHLENPTREKVTILIKDSNDAIVYRREIDNAPIFHGKFDVSKVVSGTYTMVIKSVNQTFSTAFTINSQEESLAKIF